MRTRRRLRWIFGGLCAGLLAASYPWWPPVIFDTSQPAFDQFVEMRNEKPAAWGPRPRSFRVDLFRDRPRTNFYGNEWQFVLFRGYCKRWVATNGYALPE